MSLNDTDMSEIRRLVRTEIRKFRQEFAPTRAEAYGRPRGVEVEAAVLCGIAHLKDIAQSKLSGLGFRVDPATSTKLLLDFPPGYGLGFLKSSYKSHLQLIVVTWNPCKEYMDDVWDLEPSALLAGEILEKQDLGETLSAVIYRVRHGERYRLTPGPPTPLTRSERLVLQHVAQGLHNKRVAQLLYLQEQTVKNTLRSVYRKLGICTHLEAALYYWGILQQVDPVNTFTNYTINEYLGTTAPKN